MEVEDLHFTTIRVIESGKHHQWMLKLVGETLMRDKMSIQYLQNTYYKGRKNNFTAKKHGRYHLK